MGTHRLHGIPLCYLPPGRGDILAFTLAKLVLDLAAPERCKAELTVGWFNAEIVYPPVVVAQHM